MKTATEQFKELQNLAIWMTGCGFNFADNAYFQQHKHLLIEPCADRYKAELPTDEEIEEALERSLKLADKDIQKAAKGCWMDGAKWMRDNFMVKKEK